MIGYIKKTTIAHGIEIGAKNTQLYSGSGIQIRDNYARIGLRDGIRPKNHQCI